MKKVNFIQYLVFVLGTMVAIASCQKETKSNPNPNQTPTMVLDTSTTTKAKEAAKTAFDENHHPVVGDTIYGDSVTIIATGFNVEQQKEIVSSSEPNKIIHVLGDEQKATADLTKSNNPTFTAPSPDQPLQNTHGSFAAQPSRIVYGLDDEFKMSTHANLDIEKKTIVQTDVVAHAVATPSIEQIVTPVSAIDTAVEARAIKTQDIRNIEVVEPQFIIVKKAPVLEEVSAMQFTFNLEEQAQEFNAQQPAVQAAVDFGFHQEPVAPVPVMAVEPVVVPEEKPDPNAIVRYSLEDYMEVEEQLLKSAPKQEVVEEEPEFRFTVRTEETIPTMSMPAVEETSPIDLSINEILKERAEERKRKMKDFNYKFNSASTQLNDLEREPAYKRMGVDLDDLAHNRVSRTSLGVDNNNDLQLRSNNSYLHDNVD